MPADADLAAVAAAIGDPARARMLAALLGGVALPAGELARAARVSAPTASAHLARLREAGLVADRRSGRHRYHELAGPAVAEALETLSAIAPPQRPAGLRADNAARAQARARSCYDHLAGRLGVAVTDALCDRGALEPGSLALRDDAPLAVLGVDMAAVRAGRRATTRACLDWTERRPHVAGAVGAAMLTSLLERDWVRRVPGGRALLITPAGETGLRDVLGVVL